MRSILRGLLLLCVFMAISEVTSEKNVKLCGRDFVRAVVFICGGSRWRRQLADSSEGLSGQEGYPHFPLDESASGSENDIQMPESQSKQAFQAISQSKGNGRSKQQKTIHKRSEELTQLTISCCSHGCHESSIRSLC